MKRSLSCILMVFTIALAGACATITTTGETPVSPRETWGIIPLTNTSETPNASERATAIATAVLRSRGIPAVESYVPAPQPDETLLKPHMPPTTAEALEWAAKRNIRYILTGTVTEWRYKVGLDGEPAAGVVLQVLDAKSGAVLWSAAGGRSGWSREALSAVGQRVITDLLATLRLEP